MVNENFCSDKKIGAIFLPFFGPKFGHFCSKIRFLAVFLKTAYQNFTLLGQKLETIAFNHLTVVLCLGKLSFGRFGPFLVKNTLLVVTLYGFRLFLAIFVQTVDDFLLIFVI